MENAKTPQSGSRAGAAPRRALGALLLAGACAGPGRQGPDGIALQIDALIEESNRLGSFVAVYEVRKPGEGPVTLRLAFRAPETGSLTGEGSAGSFGMWIRDGRVTLRRIEENGVASLETFDARRLWRDAEEEFGRAVTSEFPEWGEALRAGSRKEGAGVFFDLWASRGQSEESHLRLWMLFEPYLGNRLRWLERMRRDVAQVRRDGERLTLPVEGGGRIVACGLSGFPLEAQVGEGADRGELSLLTLERDCSIDEVVLSPPPADESSEGSLRLAWTHRLWVLRAWRDDWLAWLGGRIDSGEGAWDDATRGKVSRALDRLYGDLLADYAASFLLPRVRNQAGEYGEKLAIWRMDLLEGGATEEQASEAVRAEVEKWKGTYLENCATGARGWVDSHLGEPPEPRLGLGEQGFSALGRKALGRAIDEGLLPRVGELVEERVSAALAGD